MSHRWGAKLKQNLNVAGSKITDVAANVKDDITRKKVVTKDTDFLALQKEFEDKDKLLKQLVSDVTSFIGGADAILKAQKSLAEDLLKVSGQERSEMAVLCQQQIDTAEAMFQSKAEFDKKFTASFVEPINAYQGQYREISDRIRERSRRETDVDKLSTERDKFQEKGDPRLAATETRLETALTSYEELNAELKKDIPVLLDQAESFLSPLMSLMIVTQTQFWSSMATHVVALGQKVDQTKAFVPNLAPVITAKQASAVTKKFSSVNANPWERPPPALPGIQPVPAITYDQPAGSNTFQALPPAPYGQPAPQTYAPQSVPGRPQPVPQTYAPVPGHPQSVPHVPGHPQPVPHVPGHPQPVPQAHASPQPFNPFATPAPTVPANPRPPPRVPTPVFPRARALWDFTGQDSSELTFRAGDVINVTQQQGEWWTGEMGGRTGMFPANYVQLI